MAAREGSFLGKIFRGLADFFDGHRTPRTSLSRGSPREVDIVTLAIVFIGLTTAGTWIHGWHFLIWNFLFAAFFCTGTWFIFRSARWKLHARAFLIAVILLISLAAAAERVMALTAFLLLFLMTLRGGIFQPGDFLRRESLSVVAVALFCFSAYDGFAGVLEWRRNSALTIGGQLPLDCEAKPGNTYCRAGDVSFAVPDFWRRGQGSNLIKDLSSVANLRIYADGATDNSVAFAAFSAPAAQVAQQVAQFLSVQKSFLRSKGINGEVLVPQQMMKSADTWLYGLRYESATQPGYLAGSDQVMALLLTHERRGVTWFFIVDGSDISAREFILHRIISGFR